MYLFIDLEAFILHNLPLLFLIVGFICLLTIFTLRQLLKQFHEDVLSRKQRKQASVYAAGLLLLSLLFSLVSLLQYTDITEIVFLFLALSVLVVSGVLDEFGALDAWKKLILILLAAALSVYGGVKIVSLHALFGVEQLPLWGQYLLTILLLTAITQAFDIIQSIDGLSVGLGFINSLILSILLFWQGGLSFIIIIWALAGGLLALIRYTTMRGKSGFGSTPASIIGFVVGILGIKVLTHAQFEFGYDQSSADALLLVSALMIIPVFNVLRLLFQALLRYRTIDRTKVYDLKKTDRPTAWHLYAANLLVFLISILFSAYDTRLSLLLLFVLAIVILELFSLRIWLRIRTLISKHQNQLDVQKRQNQFIVKDDDNF